MKCIPVLLVPVLLALLLSSCANNQETGAVTQQSNKEASVVNDLKSPERKIIKTADFKARVTNVYQSTHLLEQSVTGMKGLVTESTTENQVLQTRMISYKNDSLKQVRSYTTTAHLTLRIPVDMIDTFMTAVADGVAFIDYRNLKLDDVTLQYLGNELKNKGSQDGDMGQTLVLARQSKDIIDMDSYKNAVSENKIDRRIQNLDILDQSNFASIRIDLYQPEKIEQLIVPNTDYLMKPSFTDAIKAGAMNGWNLFKLILIGLANIWAIALIAGIIFLIVRGRKTRMKLAK